ncbi:MAG: hypothetical protein DMG98_23780 [Acidobacteria bacterium]|nr:MAG: hypothetical protein DMG98_23780 [Acidobacteriota bacterium]
MCQYYFEFLHRRSAFAMLLPDGFRRAPRISDSRLQHTISYRLPAISCAPYGRGASVGRGRGDGVARSPGVAVGVPISVGVGVAVGVGALTTS